MNRYEVVFEKLASKKEKAFIPFTVAGDPDLDLSEQILLSYIEGGADILEIGYPFSDPIADGPVNQRAGIRAIDAGLTHNNFFSLIKKIRKKTDIPFGLLLYANTMLHLGMDEFCKKASQAGVDSILAADLPPEESTNFDVATEKYGIGRVFIVSELTPVERMKFICNKVDSFVYVVSRLGTTGTGATLSSSVKDTLKKLKSVTDKPLCVGFGISTPSHVEEVSKAGADGIIVGSALVRSIESNLTKKDQIPRILKNQVAQFKKATKNIFA